MTIVVAVTSLVELIELRVLVRPLVELSIIRQNHMGAWNKYQSYYCRCDAYGKLMYERGVTIVSDASAKPMTKIKSAACGMIVVSSGEICSNHRTWSTTMAAADNASKCSKWRPGAGRRASNWPNRALWGSALAWRNISQHKSMIDGIRNESEIPVARSSSVLSKENGI
jgi:hypothetical protein